MKVHDEGGAGRSFFNLNLTLGFPSSPQLQNELWIAKGLFPVFSPIILRLSIDFLANSEFPAEALALIEDRYLSNLLSREKLGK